MKLYYTLFLSVLVLTLSAQRNVESSLGLDSGIFTALSEYGTDNFDGNPYLYKEWKKVNVTTISGEVISAEQGKLDIWQHKLIVVKKDMEIAVNNHQVASIQFMDLNGEPEDFIKLGVEDELRYAKILKQGNIKLFEVFTKNFNKPSQGENASGYNKKAKAKFSGANKKYYISIEDERLVELKTSKKGFLKSFPEDQKNKISRLLKAKKANLRDPSDLVAVLTRIEEVL